MEEAKENIEKEIKESEEETNQPEKKIKPEKEDMGTSGEKESEEPQDSGKDTKDQEDTQKEAPVVKKDIPDFKPGDTVAVYAKIEESGKIRTQVFQGTVISIKGSGINKNFTVRKISYGVGVERVFPVESPLVEKIEVTRKGKVRRSKLYYLREKVGKKARIREER